MSLFLVVKERESGLWLFDRAMPFFESSRYDPRRGRSKKVYIQQSYARPVPEEVSCFIEAHKIIGAEDAEGAAAIVENMNQGGVSCQT